MSSLDMDSVFESLLEMTGGNQNIRQAMKSKDLAATVRAATKALTASGSIPMRLAERKSAEKSNELRKEGNMLYINQRFKEAIICFNKALAYAPNNSLEVKIAYSNMSALLYTIEDYQACYVVTKAALDLDCPAFLRDKLVKRMSLTEPKSILKESFHNMWYGMDKAALMNYVKFDVKRNAEIPCVSADVCVEDGKTVVAAKEINSGTMVALERAFVSVQDEYEEYTSCYFCHKMCFFLIPCEGCCKALFCSKECREKCSEEYHRVECDIVAYMGTMYTRDVNKMAVRAAIKMSLKLGWEQLGVASLQMGVKRLKKSSVAEAFDCNSPTSLLCHDDLITVVSNDKMKSASLICAAAVDCLGRVPDYMPEETVEREKAIDALSRVILHLNTKFLRKVAITSSAFDVMDGTYRCGAQRTQAWFSFTSKLAHSCEPNLLVVGLNDTVALVALQRIRKGDPLTISYLEHFYENNIAPCFKNSRVHQKQIYEHLQYLCQCRVCLREWDNTTQVKATLTARQKAAYDLANIAMTKSNMLIGNFVEKLKTTGAALDELTGCSNTTQHYNLYGNLSKTLNMAQCFKNENMVYGGSSKHYFRVKVEGTPGM